MCLNMPIPPFRIEWCEKLKTKDILRRSLQRESLRAMSCLGFAIPNTTKTPPLSRRNGVLIISHCALCYEFTDTSENLYQNFISVKEQAGLRVVRAQKSPRPVGAEGFDWSGRAWCYAAFFRSSRDSSWNGIVYLSFKVLSLCKANTLRRSLAQNTGNSRQLYIFYSFLRYCIDRCGKWTWEYY